MDQDQRAFDRTRRLSELFSSRDLERVVCALAAMVGQSVAIVEPQEPVRDGYRRLEVLWDLEPIAAIESREATEEELKGCVEIVLVLLREAQRYRMTSDLHLETVAADFEALQEKHKALQLSENKLRKLSASLEKKVAEQVKMIEEGQRKVFQAEKLASVGQLAAGVAHELNSPLAYIQNNLAAAREYVDDLEELFAIVLDDGQLDSAGLSLDRDNLEYIHEDFPTLIDTCLGGVERLASIVSDLKVFSNIDKQQRMFDNLNDRLETVLKMLKPQIGKNIEIVRDLTKIPPILCYPAHLGQVFYNLIQNALQAMGEEGRLVIRTFYRDGLVGIAIADTGDGIDKKVLPNIFDPFFTTKEVGKGTGLGLSVIHDIVKAHNGRVEVESEVGEGSVFTVYLPHEEMSP